MVYLLLNALFCILGPLDFPMPDRVHDLVLRE